MVGQGALLTAPAWLLAGQIAHHAVRLAGGTMPHLEAGGRPGILARLLVRVIALGTALIVAGTAAYLAWEVMHVRPIIRALTFQSWWNFSVHVHPLSGDSTLVVLLLTLLVMTVVVVTRVRPAETLRAAREVAPRQVRP